MSAFARKKGLSFKSLARIAFSDLFARPARLILTALLSVVALTLAGVAVSLAMYDEADAKADAYARTDGAILLLPAEEKIGREGSSAMALPYGAVAKAGDLLASLEGMAAAQNIAADAALWGALEDYRAQNGVHVLTFLQSVAYFSEGAQRAVASGWLAGRSPQSDGEAALPSCFANTFLAVGWPEAGALAPVAEYGGLIGREIRLAVPGGMRQMTVCGVYDCSGCEGTAGNAEGYGACSRDPASWRGALFVGEESFWSFAGDGADGLYFAGDGKHETGRALAAFLDGNPQYGSEIFEQIELCRGDVEKLSGWCGAVGGILTAFAVLLLFQFLCILLDQKKQTIGVLRMLGARGGLCVRIALTESIAFGLAVGLAAAALCAAMCSPVNGLFEALFRVRIAVMGVHGAALGAVVAAGAGVGILAGLPPGLRMALRSPVSLCHRDE